MYIDTDSTVSVPPAHPIQSGGKLLCASKEINFDFLPHGFNFKVAQFPTIANWTGTRVPGVDNVIGYDNDVSFWSFL